MWLTYLANFLSSCPQLIHQTIGSNIRDDNLKQTLVNVLISFQRNNITFFILLRFKVMKRKGCWIRSIQSIFHMSAKAKWKHIITVCKYGQIFALVGCKILNSCLSEATLIPSSLNHKNHLEYPCNGVHNTNLKESDKQFKHSPAHKIQNFHSYYWKFKKFKVQLRPPQKALNKDINKNHKVLPNNNAASFIIV